jgi:sensor histidine kinase YesM
MSYLAKFSQLMRNILENSRKSMISLEEETGTLKLYLELESMRFKNAFEYSVVIREGIIPSKTFIPPMLIQPFVENSIKHAFRDMQKKGKIHIDFQRINGRISCVIEDNGIGRSKAMEMNKNKGLKHSSLGMQVTQERLISMRKDRKIDVNYKIEDLASPDGNASGTRVLVEMPYELE